MKFFKFEKVKINNVNAIVFRLFKRIFTVSLVIYSKKD